jgi:cysteine-rich repeat protein
MGRQLGSPMCGPAGEATGPEVAYQFTAASTGLLDVKLSAAADLLLSVRGSCADDVSETACTDGTRLIQPIEAGQTVFIVVDGRTETTTGAYTLDVRSRGIECGDGNTDAGEQCDDGDEDSGDGCSSSCEIESSETEPNGTLGEADALEAPFIGQVAGGDVDLVRVVLGAGYSSIVAETRDFGDAACAELRLDSAIAILDGSGAVLAESDDFGGTYCSHAVASALPAGTYYVRVHASPLAEAASFAYVLDVSTDVCGNGVQSEAEECDNGGTDPGCTETCTILD